MKIRKATKEDIDSILAIEQNCFSRPYTKSIITDMVSHDNYIVLLATENFDIIGYVAMRITLDEGEINNIAVLSAYRSKGVASALLNSLYQTSRERNVLSILLEVNVRNNNAISLYKKHLFSQVALRKKYYGDDDAIVMRKLL